MTVGCPIIIGDGLKGTDDIEAVSYTHLKKEFLFIHPGEIEKTYPIPAAFEMYMPKE